MFEVCGFLSGKWVSLDAPDSHEAAVIAQNRWAEGHDGNRADWLKVVDRRTGVRVTFAIDCVNDDPERECGGCPGVVRDYAIIGDA